MNAGESTWVDDCDTCGRSHVDPGLDANLEPLPCPEPEPYDDREPRTRAEWENDL